MGPPFFSIHGRSILREERNFWNLTSHARAAPEGDKGSPGQFWGTAGDSVGGAHCALESTMPTRKERETQQKL
jgi:hypothetical protein